MKRMTMVAVTAAMLSPSAHAVIGGEFYCGTVPEEGPPVYFETTVKSCDGMSTVESKGMCTQKVQCTFVPDETLAAVRKAYETEKKLQPGSAKIDDIPESFVKGELYTSEWVSAVVTCRGAIQKVKGEDTPVCPQPNACKGDMSFKSREAVSDTRAAVESVNASQSVYRHQVTSDQKKAGEAK